VNARIRFLALVLVPAALAAAARPAASAVALMPVSDIRPGQHASVRTVFAGDSIETFDADIVGVLAGGRAGGDIILARATSPRVVASGIAAGMSGSPVYVDGRLVGALALGWPFSKEPIFGITPIAEMLAVLDHPEGPAGDLSSGPAGVGVALRPSAYRELAWPGDTLAAAATPPAPGMLPSALPIPLSAGGLSGRALELARPLFEGTGLLLTPGGHAAPSAKPPAPIVPGSPIAVDVLRGDLNFSAIGTVTYVDGDRLLIFGHPFFQAGDVRMPLSTAHIVGILPSLYDSFKLGVPGTPIGVATQDRRTAVGGHLGGSAPLMPFTVVVRGTAPAPQVFHFETLHDRLLMPQLLATAVMSCLLESGGSGSQQTLDWTLSAWQGREVLRMGDRAAGEGPYTDVAGAVTGPLRFLLGNTYETWRPDSVRIEVDVRPGRGQWTLRGASLLSAGVRRGGHLRVRVELERWHGERKTVDLDVDVPRELPPGHYALWIGGGAEFDRLASTRLPARYRPTSVADGLRRLAALKSSDALYTALWAHALDVTRDGEDYPDLPASAQALLAPAQSAGERIRRGDWALLDERTHPLEGVLRGEITLDLNVDDRAP
jgi:hypothetical protein